jgi:hypothetical protein
VFDGGCYQQENPFAIEGGSRCSLNLVPHLPQLRVRVGSENRMRATYSAQAAASRVEAEWGFDYQI